MTTNEMITKIYNRPLNLKASMTIKERCELQRLLTEALKYNLPERERENFQYHYDQFENDILMIASNIEMKVATDLARIEMATKRIAGQFEVVVNE